MIYCVRSDSPTFRTIHFGPGFNVVLADRTKESTKKDSRNGLGKTTLLRVIHFCLGASSRGEDGLRDAPLDGWTFSLDFDLFGQRMSVSRNTSKPGVVEVNGNLRDLPVSIGEDHGTGTVIKVEDWRQLLGLGMFGLPNDYAETRYAPSFRSLIPYFARLKKDAFSTPFEFFRKQKKWSVQVNVAFLLGLSWQYAIEWQLLRDKKKALDDLKKAAEMGLVSDIVGSLGELEAIDITLSEQVRRQEEQLRSFKVHPQYEQIESKANQLTECIHSLSNENVLDRRKIALYERTLRDERPADETTVRQMYEDAGLILPHQVVKRLEDVQEFHARIVANRKNFLSAEIESLKAAVRERERKIERISNVRARYLAILSEHGALAEYNSLQQIHMETISRLEDIRARIDSLLRFKEGKSSLRIDQEKLQLLTRADHEERREVREKAISLFNANSEYLYSAPGRLIVDVDKNGFEFNVEIKRSGSQGIERMKVFCFDLMLAQLWSAKEISPGFLIHDSTIFDGVDERQVSLALQLAARESELRGFQYICCLNSDVIPYHEFEPSFCFDDYVRLRLTDDNEEGGLLGIRY